ncbi:hypothetical protein CRUP_003383 [Coryphaenoides rupestris]|nr:hypothetical protein CRUP_003383 [Coryphaenoides rupestris]
MDEHRGTSPLPLSSLRLLCSPVHLVSGAIWRTVQQNAVSDYGMLGEFVSMVTDTVPELLTKGQHANPVAAAVSEEMQMMTVENVAEVGARHQESMYALEKDCKVLLKKLDAVPSVQRWPVRPKRGLKMKRILLQEKNARRKMPSKQILARTQTLALEPSTPSILSDTQDPFPSVTYTIPTDDDDDDDSINLLVDPSYTASVGSSSEDESLSDCSNEHHSCTASPRDGKMVSLKKQDIPKIKLLAANTTSMNKDLCLICNKHVQTDMKEHMKDHFPDGVLTCPRCHTIFKTIASLRRHFKMVCIEQLQLEPGEPSVGQGLFKCDECEKSYRYNLSLDEHKRTHNQLYCEVCRRVLRDAQTLARHKVSHTPFQCTLCEKNFVIFKQLSRHYKNAHKPSKPYKCHHCPKSRMHHKVGMLLQIRSILQRKGAQCFICNKHGQTDMKEHMKDHFPDGVLTCPRCGTLFKNMQSLRLHFKRVCFEQLQLEPGEARVGQGLLKCDECEKSYRYKLSLDKHKRTHNQLYCEVCRRVMRDAQTLARHNVSHTPFSVHPLHYENAHKPSKPYNEMTTMDGAHVEANDGDSVSLLQDPTCLAPIDSSSKDNTLHNDSNDHSYFAPNDQKDFSVTSEEQDAPQSRHAATNKVNSSTQGRQCFICNKHGQTDMKEHMKDHFPDGVLTCPRCGTLFKNMQSLRLHFKRVCFEQLQLEPGEARVGQGLLKCDECEKSYRYKLSLDKHKRTHNQLYCEVCRRVMRDAQTLARHKVSHTPFQCTLCEKHFVFFKHLSRHYENAHKPSKPYKCHHCSKEKGGLQKHEQRAHRNQKKMCHPCVYCGKMFSQSGMARHKLTHTGEKPLKCQMPDCEWRFRSASEVKSHVLRHHSAERPFECNTCGKGFIRASALNDHIKIHSGEKEHVCLVCGKAFVKLYGMNRHMQLMHTPK